MAKKKLKRKKYEGMEMIAIKGIGIRNNTKTYINGSSATKKSASPQGL